jgi:hypothetical protein
LISEKDSRLAILGTEDWSSDLFLTRDGVTTPQTTELNPSVTDPYIVLLDFLRLICMRIFDFLPQMAHISKEPSVTDNHFPLIVKFLHWGCMAIPKSNGEKELNLSREVPA